MAHVLCNIDFAGNGAMVEQKAVSDGTVLKAPPTVANRWNNLISPDSTTWDPAFPLQITDSDGGSGHSSGLGCRIRAYHRLDPCERRRNLLSNAWTPATGTNMVMSDDGTIRSHRFTAPVDSAAKYLRVRVVAP